MRSEEEVRAKYDLLRQWSDLWHSDKLPCPKTDAVLEFAEWVLNDKGEE